MLIDYDCCRHTVHASKDTTPVVKAGHPGVSCYNIICLCGLWLGGLLYIYFLCFLKASVLCTCISMYMLASALTCAHTHSLDHSLMQTLSSISASLILSWESRGVRVEDLDTSSNTGSFEFHLL